MIFTEKNYYYFGKQYNLKSNKKENGLNCVYKWSDLIINVVYYIFFLTKNWFLFSESFNSQEYKIFTWTITIMKYWLVGKV